MITCIFFTHEILVNILVRLHLRDVAVCLSLFRIAGFQCVTPFKIDQNTNQNHSTDKVQNLGNERR